MIHSFVRLDTGRRYIYIYVTSMLNWADDGSSLIVAFRRMQFASFRWNRFPSSTAKACCCLFWRFRLQSTNLLLSSYAFTLSNRSTILREFSRGNIGYLWRLARLKLQTSCLDLITEWSKLCIKVEDCVISILTAQRYDPKLWSKNDC